MRYINLLATLLLPFLLLAQAPQAFDFQGVARDASGNVMSSQAISLRISILAGSPGGDVAYQETHSVTTSPFGLFTIQVGNGTPTQSTFPSIGWGASSHFIQVELDASGGSNFQDMGTTQLLSVPYALHARATDCFTVSLLGDTLHQGNGCHVIIPGISVANGGCLDLDGDGFYDRPGCGPVDCDDNDPAVYPGAPELCGDGKDNDCDGGIDNNADVGTHLIWYLDADEDGYGDPTVSQLACAQPAGYVDNGDDCDDSDPLLFPGQGCSLVCSEADHDYIDQNQAVYLHSVDEWFMTCLFSNNFDLQAALACLQGDLESEFAGGISPDCHGCALDRMECLFTNCAQSCIGNTTSETCITCMQSQCTPAFINCIGLTDADGDGWASGSDCDDNDPDLYFSQIWYQDFDGDGYGNLSSTLPACTQPIGYVDNPYDCDDTDPDLFAGQGGCPGIECGFFYGIPQGTCGSNAICDNGMCVPCQDLDGDGFTNCDGDCDDSDPSVHPGAPELCDGVDNNCDGLIDEGACQGSDLCTAEDAAYIGNNQLDFLNAVYARSLVNQSLCISNPPYAQCQIDNLTSLFPTATLPVGNDCQECAVEYLTCYYTNCHGNSCLGALNTECVSCLLDSGCLNQFIACVGLVDSDGDGWAAGSDCNDNVMSIHPFAMEHCDGLDNDCDGQVDEEAPIWYPDQDNDGYGVSSGAFDSCDDPGPGYALVGGDCDDNNPNVNPGATEICGNGIDDNCDGQVDEDCPCIVGTVEACGNNVGACQQGTRTCMPGGVWSACVGEVGPSAEVCNGIDDNCDGQIDENPVDGLIWYRDADGDGFGDADDVVVACAAPIGYVGNSTDCNDTNALINPAASELCNGIDDNCDGQVDEGNVCDPCTGPDVCFIDGQCYNSGESDPFAYCRVCEPLNSTDSWSFRDAGVVCIQGDYCTLSSFCDGTGACATQVPAPAGTPCDDGNPNTVNDVCDGAGNCSGTPCTDADGDGFFAESGCGTAVDCDDTDPEVYPGAIETCNGIDDNCDGQIDEGVCGPEICDGIDNNGNGLVDADDPDLVLVPCELQQGVCAGVTKPAARCVNGVWLTCTVEDYENGSPFYAINETCDGLDNDCDGQVDEDNVCDPCTGPDVCFIDGQCYNSGESDPFAYCRVCEPLNSTDSWSFRDPGVVCNQGDDCTFDSFCDGMGGCAVIHRPFGTPCNDGNANTINDMCDGAGNCSGTPCIDADGDGFFAGPGCGTAVDCDDNDPSVFPSAIEFCNGIDDNCNGQVDEGFNLASDPLNCGACGNVCPSLPNATVACNAGACVIVSCAPGFADCDGNTANGCETNLMNSNSNCGSCFVTCPPRPNATVGCVNGNCVIISCNSGFSDCDGIVSNGCEINLATSLLNCGGCGNVCALPNANTACNAGSCVLVSCQEGFANCDGVAANGCETFVGVGGTCP